MRLLTNFKLKKSYFNYSQNIVKIQFNAKPNNLGKKIKVEKNEQGRPNPRVVLAFLLTLSYLSDMSHQKIASKSSADSSFRRSRNLSISNYNRC